MHCLNCGTSFSPPARFCLQCGQRTDTARLTIRDIVGELMHSFVNVERSAFVFSLALLTRPGHVAREYVEGKRRRHFGPFATLAVTVGVTALAVKLSGFEMLAQDGFSRTSDSFLKQHFNWLLLAQLPLLGAVCAVLFRGALLTFSEHMVLSAYALSVRAIFLALVWPLSYLTSATAPNLAQVIAYWALWYAYYGWAASQFYAGPRLASAIKGTAAAAIAHGAIMLFVNGCAAIYAALAAAWARLGY